MSSNSSQQAGSAPQGQGQQQGQSAPTPQHTAGKPQAPAPVIRDWAAI